MTITLKNGEQKTAELSNPIGHHDRPMTDAQVVDKFKGLAGRKLAPQVLERVLERLWRIEADPQWATVFQDLEVKPR
jgi:2-methylcitrate dehydratase PrpD